MDPFKNLLLNFPFDKTTIDAITQRREQLDNMLFFDIILSSAGIQNPAGLYPPRSVAAFHKLRVAYEGEDAEADKLKQDCINYYLLKRFSNAAASKYRHRSLIPAHFVKLTDAYFLLDSGSSTETTSNAISLLLDPRIPPTDSQKILKTLSRNLESDDELTTFQDILRYIRTSDAVLRELWEIELHARALTKVASLRAAWRYQRSFGGEMPQEEHTKETRTHLLTKIVEECLLRMFLLPLLELVLTCDYQPNQMPFISLPFYHFHSPSLKKQHFTL
jgi:hypothetical protein